jgi:hypothetical protein
VTFLKGLRNAKEDISQESLCSGGGSKQVPPECISGTLAPHSFLQQFTV